MISLTVAFVNLICYWRLFLIHFFLCYSSQVKDDDDFDQFLESVKVKQLSLTKTSMSLKYKPVCVCVRACVCVCVHACAEVVCVWGEGVWCVCVCFIVLGWLCMNGQNLSSSPPSPVY